MSDDVLAYDAAGALVVTPRMAAIRCAYCSAYTLPGAYCQCPVGRRLRAVHERYLAHDPRLDELDLATRRLEFARWLAEHERISEGTDPANGTRISNEHTESN